MPLIVKRFSEATHRNKRKRHGLRVSLICGTYNFEKSITKIIPQNMSTHNQGGK
jgi:hypothetical protein